MNQRETFGSRMGFLLLSAGCAIGIGNVWRFPYVVGQNGAMLSGGQKQKIALARALVHDKPIIIFDEATSNTDAYSEQQINGLLDTRLKDKTVIVITHKKEILSKVDQIVVLKEGVVADLGKYDDLIGKSDELNVMLEKAE